MSTTGINPSRTKIRYTTGNPYEQRYGYDRAIRKGSFIFVSGTTAIDKTTGVLQAPGNAYDQAGFAMRECISAVEALDGKKEDICRIRIFVAGGACQKHDNTEAIGKQFRENFVTSLKDADVGIAATMIVVGEGGFVDPEMLVEVEVDAIVL
ncbi:hypothetical protein EPUS_07626 [Endocarpon pusillum Z07020]|uniref:YjgH family protein n=1 Tax=Endocarpon pusillum (strain Z07020 / HMAS-L-300199) TaxID=1263415 RepID=U1GXI2_ENDPU|nr:uncharacterized protein EPUS_07626 [Endocarpon pusillum Z07020]ERF76836.1 hypothetical protein EPUS_07626 [Endocarpon pusillum Z07020]